MPVKRSTEAIGLLFLLILSLGSRLVFVSRFPTIPYSDFEHLVGFGEYLHTHGIFANEWFWQFFNPGLPVVLSVLFRIFPGDPAAVARLATVLACGLLPLPPYLLWRGVLPFGIRLLTGLALAVWPGQVMFSGVVAQDNWVLLPTVFLAVLAVRALAGGMRTPLIVAGLLYGAGVALRQEMLLPLFPLFLAAAGMGLRDGWRRWAAAGLAAGVPLLVLIAHRGIATGRYTLSTEHAGLSVLGAYVPGAAKDGWIDPYAFIASVRPDLLRDPETLRSQSTGLALREALRRPGFHIARIGSEMVTYLVLGEADSLYWSLQAPDVLPPALHEQAMAFALDAQRPLRYEMAGIQGLFLAAILIGFWRRSAAILVLASAVLLKLAIHAIIAAQARYFFPVTALEILAIALAAYEAWIAPPAGKRARLALALGVGLVFCLTLLYFRLRLEIYVQSHDTDFQRTYHFPLAVADHGAALNCAMDRGSLVFLSLPLRSTQSATIRTFQPDPSPGDSAAAVCELTATGKPQPLILQVLDPYARGGLPNRMLQRVEVDGAEVYSHDVAKEPGTGWANVPLGDVGEGTRKKVVIEVKALQPDPGANWGSAAVTAFQLSRN